MRLSDEERARGRAVRDAARAARVLGRRDAANAQRARFTRRLLAVSGAVSVVAWILTVWCAQLIVAGSNRSDFEWGALFGGRGAGAEVHHTFDRNSVVLVSMLVMAAPVLLALAGVLQFKFPRSKATAPAGAMFGYCSVAAVAILVPNFLGCLLVTANFGGATSLLVLPEMWPQLTFFGAALGLIWLAGHMSGAHSA